MERGHCVTSYADNRAFRRITVQPAGSAMPPAGRGSYAALGTFAALATSSVAMSFLPCGQPDRALLRSWARSCPSRGR
jgi:hypothetical protein